MQWSERIGRRLKPRDLHVFMAVAEKGNMAKAAEQLAISRPVVSKTIADLEHTLGVRLLDRTPKGVEPTLYGRALLKRSLAVFEELRQSVNEIEFLADPSGGELRVGCTEVPAAGLVAAAIDIISRRHPRMVVVTEQGSRDTVLDLLRERRCEVAVLRVVSAEPDLDVEALFSEDLFVVAGPRSRWAGRRRIDLADLADDTWILSRHEVVPGGPAFEAFRARGIDVPKAVVLSDSLNLRYGLLASGRFLTLIPGSALHYGSTRAPIRVLPIKLPRWLSPTCVVSLKNRTQSPLAELFVEQLRELARPLSKIGRQP